MLSARALVMLYAPTLGARLHILPSVELSVVYRVQVFHNLLRISEKWLHTFVLLRSREPGTFGIDHMNYLKPVYLRPQCEWCLAPIAEVVCTSPDGGGLEDIGYEDWVVTSES